MYAEGKKNEMMIKDGQEDNRIKEEEQVSRYDCDPQAIQYLNQVVQFRLGQTLDDVRGDATILSGISKPITQL